MTKLFTDDELADEPEVIIPEDDPLKPFTEKYKDPQGIAKAIVEKDTFIKRLQRENAEFRAKQINENNVAEVVDRLLASRPNTPNPVVETPSAAQPSEQPTSGISLADVEKLLAKKEETLTAAANAKTVRAELEKLYGPSWVEEVRKKAKELGESVEFMDTLAQTKPSVMLKLFAPAMPQKVTPSLFNSTVNTTTQSLTPGNVQRTMKYYKDMKAKNPVQYNTPAVQNQMHKDALQLREAFFDA